MNNGKFFNSEANINRDKWKHADSGGNGQSDNSTLSEIEIKQKHHEAIIRQMKIANAVTTVIAIAALGSAISFISKLFK